VRFSKCLKSMRYFKYLWFWKKSQNVRVTLKNNSKHNPVTNYWLVGLSNKHFPQYTQCAHFLLMIFFSCFWLSKKFRTTNCAVCSLNFLQKIIQILEVTILTKDPFKAIWYALNRLHPLLRYVWTFFPASACTYLKANQGEKIEKK
jgi:hypothetical protein